MTARRLEELDATVRQSVETEEQLRRELAVAKEQSAELRGRSAEMAARLAILQKQADDAGKTIRSYEDEARRAALAREAAERASIGERGSIPQRPAPSEAWVSLATIHADKSAPITERMVIEKLGPPSQVEQQNPIYGKCLYYDTPSGRAFVAFVRGTCRGVFHPGLPLEGSQK